MGRFYSKKVDNKYGHFDSTIEANYFEVLLEMQNRGEISELERQKPFLIMDAFKYDGKAIRKMEYFSDFCYWKDGRFIVVDTKGAEYLIEETFKIKLKLMKQRYPEYKYEVVLCHKGIYYNIEDKEQKKTYKLATAKKKK